MSDAPGYPMVHIAGAQITINDRYLRQRCAWCGTVMIDYDLQNIAVQVRPGEVVELPGTWDEGALVEMVGRSGWVVPLIDDGKVPANCCSMLDPAVTV